MLTRSDDAPRRGRLGVMVLVVAVSLVLLPSARGAPPSQSASTVAVDTAADAFVRASAPNQNFGSRNTFGADADPLTMGYVRFDTAPIPADARIARATLVLTVDDGSDDGGQLYRVPAGWDESTITYDNFQPPLDQPVGEPIGDTGGRSTVSVDVTEAVQPGAPVSFGIANDSADGVFYVTREGAINGLGAAPQLVIDYFPSITAADGRATYEFPATIDTHVDSAKPDSALANAGALFVRDGDRKGEAYVRFDVDGLDGLVVERARIQFEVDDFGLRGGAAYTIDPAAWDESTTWATRPPRGFATGAGFGKARTGTIIDFDVTPFVVGDGAVSFAIVPTVDDVLGLVSSEGAASAPGRRAPTLVLDVRLADAAVDGVGTGDGLVELMPFEITSSNPTNFASNRRLAVSSGGRILAVGGLHADGQRLLWRDADERFFHPTSTGEVGGLVLAGESTGDWASAIAVSDTGAGEAGWVITARDLPNGAPSVVGLRRLAELDAGTGPVVGERVPLTDGSNETIRPSVVVGPAPDGTPTGYATWTEVHHNDATSSIMVATFDPDASTPAPTSITELGRGAGVAHATSLLGPDGPTIVIRRGTGPIQVYSQNPNSGAWKPTGAVTGTEDNVDALTAVAVDDGVLVALEDVGKPRSTRVWHFPSNGGGTTDEPFAGQEEGAFRRLDHPALVDRNGRIELVGLDSGGNLVSFHRRDNRSWRSGQSLLDKSDLDRSGERPNVVALADGRLGVLIRAERDGDNSRLVFLQVP